MNLLADPATNAANALKCEMASEVLRSSGELRLKVTGWSMLPSIWPGDTLMVERAGSGAVSMGDIVLFGRDRRLFAHRVVAKRKLPNSDRVELITRGDGMPRPDPAVAESELLGKVSFIVRNGRLIEPSRNPGFSARAVSALVRRSSSAARIVVGVHAMRTSSQEQSSLCQS
jgi:Peptidase S24-like